MSLHSTTTMWSNSLQSPAYNVVSARTTLARPAPPSSPVPVIARAKPQKVEWPPPVREYVGRAFDSDNVIKGISREEMTSKLKDVIGFFAERSQLSSVDWATHPLPQEIIRDERATAQAAATLISPDGFTNALSDIPLSKKRKSQDREDLRSTVEQATIPPWRRTNLEDRITHDGSSEKRHKKNGLSRDAQSKFDQADLERRRQRFNLSSSAGKSSAAQHSPRNDVDVDVMSEASIVGTNQSLEKSYFRLTAPPKPETVRPQHILEKTLQLITRRWREEKNYNYVCNQMKSLRQDLTVQHIKNAFTVKVYEIHARIALEKGDLGEYNQCQTQLKTLYLQNLGGNPAEFTAYRILYFVYTCNKTDMNDLLAELTTADKHHPWIKNALDIRSSLALGNYHKFFKLYLTTENMGSYLVDMFLGRERLHALANISRAYITVALRFLTDELSFDNDVACREYLESIDIQQLIEEKTDDKGQRQDRVKVKEAAGLIEGLRQAAFAKVDIKGQI